MLEGKFPSESMVQDEKSFDEFGDWIGVDRTKPKKTMVFKQGNPCAKPS